MAKIDQALFGYSNGHRLLESSIKLSIASQRLLENLSDLSGNYTSKDFDGYYTGCWLPDDNFYAISKTWYAIEMPRTGCAWTHTLFFDIEKFFSLVEMPIDLLFKRPNINDNNFLSYYKTTMQVNETDGDSYSKTFEALWLLNTIISNKQNIAICYDNAVDFNLLFAFLFQLMGVAFFKEFSFCTGSQSNRMIKDKSLNLQIMPSNISKVALRSLSTVVPFEKRTDNSLCDYITSLNELLEIKQFALRIDNGCYSFNRFLDIQKIYYSLYRVNSVGLKLLISLIQNAYTSDKSLKVFARVVDIFVEDSTTKTNNLNLLVDLFFCISTTKDSYDNFINSLDISRYLKHISEIYNEGRTSVLQLIANLLASELNVFGEKLLEKLAYTIDSSDLVQLLSETQTHAAVLLQSNWKLANSKDLWKMPLEIQYEVIQNISYAFNVPTNDDVTEFSKLLFLIFENGNEEVSNQLFAAFGDFSIATYFEWIQNNNINKRNWVYLCKNNPIKSLSLLQSTSKTNDELFYSLLKVIDPWDKSMSTIDTKTWEELYVNYCKDNSNTILNDAFAKFMLQVMINTKVKLSDTSAYFVFMQVHKILESTDFDNAFWNKITSHLPEVKWYNSWDKCKR